VQERAISLMKPAYLIGDAKQITSPAEIPPFEVPIGVPDSGCYRSIIIASPA